MRSLRHHLFIGVSLLLFPFWTSVHAKARVPDRIQRESSAFDLEDVRLLDGPFKKAMRLDAKYLLRLEPDRLLSWFRKEAGLEPKAEVYGWEKQGVAGHSLRRCWRRHGGSGSRLLISPSPVRCSLSAITTCRVNTPEAGEHFSRKWRHARDGGWVSFDLKVLPDKPVSLVCTYWGGETGARRFDVLADGVKIATQSLHNDKPGQFFEVTYAIPEALTSGKTKNHSIRGATR